ncbi:hypothetical protein CARUB_v10018640mg [Capsella rubella]|uniref:C2H2-type domain-containing protein n=1 Tax=Capsella rubella TaxID=81985 RepID=R0HN18_9BRAS|nr:hypothetical protein CARUB_v10018640mg [Capsella rubella]
MEHEMDEAAMSLVMLSERVCGDESMCLDQFKPIKEKVFDCVESILGFKEMFTHLGFEKSVTCSDVVVALRSELQSNSSRECNICGKSFGCYQALGGHKRLHRSIKGKLESKEESSLGKKTVSNPSERPESSPGYKCSVCGKSFGCFQALGGHKRLHRSIKGKLESKEENTKDGSSLFGSSEDKKIVSEPSEFEASQEEKILDCVESKQDFRELHPLNCELQKRPESSSSYKCNVCGKSFGCFQALGGHKGLHRMIRKQSARKKEYNESDNSLSHSSEAKKIVSKPSSFEVSQEKVLHCVELKQDFSELFSYSGLDESSSSCSKTTSFSALPSTLRCELQKKTQSYDCKICGKSFVRPQSLSNHQRVHRPNSEQLSRKRKNAKDYNSLSDSLEAKKIVTQPLSFEVSQEKILHCVESKQDFSELFSHPGFDKSISCSIIPLSSSQRSKPQSSNSTKGESEDGYSLFGVTDSEAKKILTPPLSFEVSQDKILHCVESKQDFSGL